MAVAAAGTRGIWRRGGPPAAVAGRAPAAAAAAVRGTVLVVAPAGRAAGGLVVPAAAEATAAGVSAPGFAAVRSPVCWASPLPAATAGLAAVCCGCAVTRPPIA